LTDEGRALFERTRNLLREIGEVGQELSSGGSRPHGVLRVSAPALFANTQGGALATQFCRRYPEVRLELVGEDRRVDLAEDGYDVAIRVNPHPDTEWVGRCFARDEILIVAPPLLPVPPALGHGADAQSPVIPAVAMIGQSSSTPWRIEREGGLLVLAPDYRLCVSSLLMVRDAVLAGAGAAQLPRSLAREAVEAGRLSIWGTLPERGVELWALHSSRRLVSPKVAAFMAYLLEAFPDRQL
jgi:DNA-binding transcriptional LysR family regulator